MIAFSISRLFHSEHGSIFDISEISEWGIFAAIVFVLAAYFLKWRGYW
ncbi:hypothetical protein BH10PSE11_BH10PSE11_27570 [soil metagenome]